MFLIDAVLWLLVAAWCVLVAAMLIGTVVLAFWVAWDGVVYLIKKSAERNAKRDQIEALEKLWRDSS